MKLTKEDIKKYGSKEENKILKEGAGGLYIVVGWISGWDYKGSDLPIGIFNSLKKARINAEETAKKNKSYNSVDIFQYQMNISSGGYPTLIEKIR